MINRQGQSAIEYLMTYGWMLLIVAVVGGAIFSIVQGESIESSSGFSGSDLTIENFGLSQSSTLDLVVRNTAADQVQVDEIKLVQGGEEVETNIDKDISVGESRQFSALGVVEESASSTVNIEITYDRGGLTNQVVTGSVSGSLNLDPEAAAPNDNWAFVDVSEANQTTIDTSEMGDFYIMKYEASRKDATSSSEGSSSVAVSQQGVVVWDKVHYTTAKSACKANGDAYSLPTNRQWQTATEAEVGNSSTFLRGNDDGAKSYDEPSETCSSDPEYSGRCLTGTGPDTWSTSKGVADLHGNVWEMTSLTVDQSHPIHFGGDTDYVNNWNNSGYPTDLTGSGQARFGGDRYQSSSNDNRVVKRGGDYTNQGIAGAFSFAVDRGTSHGDRWSGFRCAY